MGRVQELTLALGNAQDIPFGAAAAESFSSASVRPDRAVRVSDHRRPPIRTVAGGCLGVKIAANARWTVSRAVCRVAGYARGFSAAFDSNAGAGQCGGEQFGWRVGCEPGQRLGAGVLVRSAGGGGRRAGERGSAIDSVMICTD